MPEELCLLDSNILIRWVQPDDAIFFLTASSLEALEQSGAVLCYASQNLGEFWNALTRPVERNGYGLTPEQAYRRAQEVGVRFRLLPDLPQVHHEWLRLLIEHRISGVQVHDARLTASMLVHGVRRILTFNTRDFARFPKIEAIHPSQFAATL